MKGMVELTLKASADNGQMVMVLPVPNSFLTGLVAPQPLGAGVVG